MINVDPSENSASSRATNFRSKANFDRGFDLLQLGRYEEAIERFDAAAATNSDFTEIIIAAKLGKAQALIGLGSPLNAAAEYYDLVSLAWIDRDDLQNPSIIAEKFARIRARIDSILMGGEEFEATIKQGPSERLVLLPGESPPITITQNVCALLNGPGGVILIGVKASGDPSPPPDGVIASELESQIREHLSPQALFTLTSFMRPTGQVWRLDVPEGQDKPYTVRGLIFVRIGAKLFVTQEANSAQAVELVTARTDSSRRWERLGTSGLTVEELDTSSLASVIQRASDLHGFPLRDSSDLLACLGDFGMLQGNQITNAADVLFGVRVAQRNPQTRVRAIRFEGERSSRMLDERFFEGTAFKLLDMILGFVEIHNVTSADFSDAEPERITHRKFPYKAVREGIINALVHRDYEDFSGGIAIRLFADRLEIWNSGALPFSKAQLRRIDYESKPTNPDIALGFYFAGLMERAGRGVSRILAECKAAGLREPTWESREGVLLTLYSTPVENMITLEHRAILAGVGAGEMLEVDNLEGSERTVRRRIADLVEAGYLHRQGEGRATTYFRTGKVLEAPSQG